MSIVQCTCFWRIHFVIFCGFAIQKWGPSQNTIFGPSPAPFPNIHFVHSAKYLFFIILGLGQVKTGSGSSTAARAGQGAEHCGQGRLGGRALRLGQARGRALWPGRAFIFNCFQQNQYIFRVRKVFYYYPLSFELERYFIIIPLVLNQKGILKLSTRKYPFFLALFLVLGTEMSACDWETQNSKQYG